MIKNIAVAAAILFSTVLVLVLVLVLVPVSPAAASPQNCNCTWMATSYDAGTGEFGYEWVCPDPATCVDEYTPDPG